MPNVSQPELLPTTRAQMRALGWEALDVLLVTGDAYVDHPAFGAALLGRHLVARGFRVGVVAQPRWQDPGDVARMGRPLLLAGVTAGALDSMLAHYTAFRKKRRDDAYTPGGRAGARPNRAAIVYANLVRRAFPGLPLVLGGIEASLRRASHYDFWTDRIRRSILLDARADLVLYGMAERSLALAAAGQRARIFGSAFVGDPAAEIPAGAPRIELPSHEAILEDPRRLMAATLALERQVHQGRAWAVQRCGDRAVIFTPPPPPSSEAELDALYGLPFSRRAHPSHGGSVPAAGMIGASITSHRGCGGGCSFCSLALHQGRRVRSRSRASIEQEARALGGSITDVGGPSANMWGARCTADAGACERRSCLHPTICESFEVPQRAQLELLRGLRAIEGVRHVRVASGVRHDLALRDDDYLRGLVGELVGGQLKLAPEHCSDRVLELMRKPRFASFERFCERFEEVSRAAGKEQYIVPYLLSAFPGCTDDEMRALAQWLRRRGWRPRQVQCFVPTPGTVATAMYHAGIDPRGRPIHVARSDAERLRQHRILVEGS